MLASPIAGRPSESSLTDRSEVTEMKNSVSAAHAYTASRYSQLRHATWPCFIGFIKGVWPGRMTRVSPLRVFDVRSYAVVDGQGSPLDALVLT